jgi:hypothetical protein
MDTSQLVKEVTCELPSREIVKVVWLYMYRKEDEEEG